MWAHGLGKPTIMAALKSPGDDLYVDLLLNVLHDSRHLYLSEADLRRDVETIRSRVAREGLPFLTVSLPKLGKALDRSLETGMFERPKEFKSRGNRSEIPALFSGMLMPAFDDEGRLVEMSAERLKALRQATFFFYKLALPYSKDQEEAVIRSFLETEEEVSRYLIPQDDWDVATAADLVEDVLLGFDPKDIVPRHGPGAVATGEKLDAKWRFSRLYADIHRQYPYYDYFVVGGASELLDRIRWYRSLERCETSVAKVVLVPKDSRGPRLISCEPLEKQWIQQGLGRKLVDHLESHWLTKGNVNFTDQGVNRKLALVGSTDGRWATLDLKDASDRVSLALVKRLFPKGLYHALCAARSSATKLPDGSEVALTKHAPMGSALCFPVMALTIWAISVAAIYCLLQRRKSLPEVAKAVFVYGDDLIVETEYYETVVEALERCGLRVNSAKCFRQTGPSFRESCGMDAYKGVPVTPVKVRSLFSGNPGDGTTYASWVAYANELKAQGFPSTSERVWKAVETTYGKVPYGVATSAFPCRIESSWLKSLLLNLEKGFPVRESPDRGDDDVHYMSVQVKAKFLKDRKEPTTVDGWPRLLRNLTAGFDEDPNSVVLPQSTQLKSGWRRL